MLIYIIYLFGGSYLFEEVTFRLGAETVLVLLEKNGAGKSTMLKILAKTLLLIRKYCAGKESENGIFASGYRF
jgi:ABC-type cobalamin/Fe3+-siderophores transport system ATPase subunit